MGSPSSDRLETNQTLDAASRQEIFDQVQGYHDGSLRLSDGISAEGPLDKLVLGAPYHSLEAATLRERARLAAVPGEELWASGQKALLTPYPEIRAIFKWLQARNHLGREDVVVELGCGLGRLMLYGAMVAPEAQFAGIEAAGHRAQSAQRSASRLGL